jgi:hypothetical protein
VPPAACGTIILTGREGQPVEAACPELVEGAPKATSRAPNKKEEILRTFR